MTALPSMMPAIEIARPGGPEALQLVERPVPEPGAGEVLIRVAAAGVNRPDILQRQGKYPPPAGVTDIPGLEIAGQIAAVGSGVAGWSIGAPAMALVAGGGYAGYCVVPVQQCLPIPATLSPIEAAAVPESFFTVWTNLFEIGRLTRGDYVLIHGGSSGIGTTAIQLAKAFGAQVFATAGSAEKCQACLELGAIRAIDYQTEDFVSVLREAADGHGIDIVLDMVGGDYLARNIELLAPFGRHVSIAFLKGAKVTLNLEQVMRKRLVLTGSTLRNRPPAEKGRLADALRLNVWPLLEQRQIRPIIDSVFPLSQAADAHRLMESSRHIGKIVLSMGDV